MNTIISLACIALSLTIGLVSIAYGQVPEAMNGMCPEGYHLNGLRECEKEVAISDVEYDYAKY
jgi:hypothetical protein